MLTHYEAIPFFCEEEGRREREREEERERGDILVLYNTQKEGDALPFFRSSHRRACSMSCSSR